MIVKARILYILCTLSLLLSLSMTESEWITCTNTSPDEYMDLDFGPVEAVIEVKTREVQFRHFFVFPLRTSSFPLGSELSSTRSFRSEFAETPILSEEHSGVILLI
jgi:hypothetical protein